DKQVDLLFELDKGNKVYFGKFNVLGNSKTRDKVVRRELKILESELYNETRRRESEEAIKRLGFFEEVTFKTAIDPTNTDIMNLDIVVKERSTGQIQFGAGYGSATGFTMQGSVSQTNFLGKGQNLSASLNVSSTASQYSLSMTEPYYNDSLWSLGGDIYQSGNSGREDYIENHEGGSVRTGYPIAEYTRLFFKYKYDKTLLDTKYLQNKPVTDLTLFPLSEASGDTSSGTLTLEYDTRNDRFMPTRGLVSSASVEYAGLGGSIKYLKTGTIFRYYKNIFWDVVFRNSLQYDRVDQLEGRPIPFPELFVLGGPYSLRGYRSYRVGKMKLSETIRQELIAKGYSDLNARKEAMRFVGGTQQALYQGELQFPLIKEANIMGVGFFDVGSAEDELIDTRFFSDLGFGIRWFSPIGPLRFEWGFPLNRDPDYHDPTVFEFSIGAPF
ncbi:MAG TPA: outer membrane protein assembly factor BamA, partial [Pseudobdellovibrionaceae bacterium]|nr:outer membrane protein assembly factor BamA [Pseudobdellovibrionaceae bacterium]